MPTRKLSQRAAAEAQPGAKPYELHDRELTGLLLRVQPSGVRSWCVQWARGRRVTLGKYPAVSATAARTRALAVLADAAAHGTPAAARKAERKAERVTLAQFVATAYRPWACANLRQGKEESRRLLAVWRDLADVPLSDITAWQVERWRASRRKAGIATATVNRDLALLKSALAHARKWGMLDADPLAAVRQRRVDNARVRYLSPAESQRLRAALSARPYDHIVPAVLLTLNTGLRFGELVALTWADIDLPAKVLTVRAATAKSGRTRHLPLNAEAIAALRAWHDRQPQGRLFPYTTFKRAWATLLREAGITGLRWHDLRHDFASQLVMHGVDLNTVRELLGHADMKMTLRYAHLAPSHTAAAVALLGAK